MATSNGCDNSDDDDDGSGDHGNDDNGVFSEIGEEGEPLT